METLIDGFYGLEGGMNSALSPHLIGDNQYHVGFNVTARGGQVGTRPAFSFFSGALTDYRGGLLYKHPNGSLSFLAVSGRSIVSMDASAATSPTPFSVSANVFAAGSSNVHFCEVGPYVVIQTGVDTPVVLKAPMTSSDAWTVTTYGSKLPIGTHTAYGHGRIFTTVPSGAILPKLKVVLTASTLVCSVTNGGGGYNRGATNTFTKGSTNPKPVPKLTLSDGTVVSHSSLTSYGIKVVRGLITEVSVGGTFTEVPSVEIVTLNNNNVEVNDGSLGAGAIVVSELAPTSVASITGGNTGSGYTLTPRVTFDNTGTGGSGAAATVTRNSDNLTFSVNPGGSGYRRPPRLVIENVGGSSQEIVASDIAYGGSSEFFDIESSFSTGDGTAIILSDNVPFSAGESLTIEGHSSFPSIDGTWSVASVGKIPSRKRGVATILVEDEGAGYKSPPTVVIDPPPEGGRRARATAVLTTAITGVRVTNRGSGYDPDLSGGGANLSVVLVDDWAGSNISGFQAPRLSVVLGEGKAIDKVETNQVKEVIVEDGGGPYPKTSGRTRKYNNVTNTWDFEKKNGVDIIKNLPLPPRLRIEDGFGVAATKPANKTVFSYPKGKKHAVLVATVSSVISEIQITDGGAGYREVPNVELIGGKSTSPGRIRALLDSSTTTNQKAFIIPALTATEGIGGRVRRALGGTFEDIFNHTENIYLAEGGGFNISGFVGRIAGLFFLPVANTTSGRGDLVAIGDRGAVTLAVGSPRTEWKDMAFIRVILSETGAVSEKAYTVAEGDVFFYSREGLRSYRNASTGEVDGSVTPLDTELRGVIGTGRQSGARLAYFDNRILTTLSPNPNNQSQFRGLGVLDWSSSYAGQEISRTAWDGFWLAPGQNPNGTVSQYFLDVHSSGNVLLAVCTNGIFKVDPSLSGDKVTTAATLTPINWALETRSVDFKLPSAMKRLLRASLWIQDASGANRLSFQWRTENRPNWDSWVTNQDYQGGPDVSNYAYRIDVPMLLNTEADTDKEMRTGLDRGQSFQFKIKGQGKLKFVKFMFHALPVVESQYGVVSSSAITIVPTGTSESYPL